MIQVPKSSSSVTRAECRKQKFSGIRQDPILHNIEIWVLGNMAREVTQLQMQLDPKAVERAYANVFNLDEEQVILA